MGGSDKLGGWGSFILTNTYSIYNRHGPTLERVVYYTLYNNVYVKKTKIIRVCMGINDEESLHQQTQHCRSAVLQKMYTLTLKKKNKG